MEGLYFDKVRDFGIIRLVKATSVRIARLSISINYLAKIVVKYQQEYF